MIYNITYEANPRSEDLQILNNGIMEHAKQKKAMKQLDFFAFFIRDREGKIVGGCGGDNMYGGFFVGQLWVTEQLRGKGYGTKLMEAAEKLAKESGCNFMAVNTMDWEALDFYKKLGFYVEFERSGFDKNSIFYFLRKDLDQRGSIISKNDAKQLINAKADISKIKMIPASINDYPTIQNMGRFYVYDMSEYLRNEVGWEMPEDGLYECIDFKKYWDNDQSFPYIIRYGNELAGFVIVDKKGSDPSINFNMAQFYILRKLKNMGIGRHVAHGCFKKYRGIWEVMVIPGNTGAYHFWKSVISQYSNNYVEYTKSVPHFGNSIKNIFKFDSGTS